MNIKLNDSTTDCQITNQGCTLLLTLFNLYIN